MIRKVNNDGRCLLIIYGADFKGMQKPMRAWGGRELGFFRFQWKQEAGRRLSRQPPRSVV